MLVLTAGVNRFYVEPLHELWFPEDGKSTVGATMALRRFKDMSDFTQAERREIDALAAFRDVWETVLVDLRRYYIPEVDVTVDEELVPSRGR